MTTVDTQPQQPAHMNEELKAQQRAALHKATLRYHELPTPDRISVTPTKPLSNQRDLALAYSLSVAAACGEIIEDVANSFHYTAHDNLVGVVANGTTVLGLGDVDPETSKPIMEGRAGLFKKFADIDVFDIEINKRDPQKLVDIIASLEPTSGGINLEDIKAPGYFFVKRELRKRMKIPVFHDDQHGTAIVVGADITNALRVIGKDTRKMRLVVLGAGAAVPACLDLLVDLGLPRKNIWVTDLAGVIYEGRTELTDLDKAHFAQKTDLHTLVEVINDADIFLDLSAAGVLKQDVARRMVDRPIIFVLANLNPEILPGQTKEVHPDAIMDTGRTDYPNQVNNILCLPSIFRGTLDVGAAIIAREIEVAVVYAVAELTRQEQSDIAASTYGIQDLSFDPEYLILRPFDPHLIVKIAPVVARAAVLSGVARHPIEDTDAYCQHLQQLVYHPGTLMRPIFSTARKMPMKNERTIFAEGEERRILYAIQIVVDETLAGPTLIDRPSMIAHRIGRFGLRLREGVDFTVVNPEHDERFHDYWKTYYKLVTCKGVTPQYAKLEMRHCSTLIGTLMAQEGEAGGMIYDTISNTAVHLRYIDQVLDGTNCVYTAMNGLVLPGRQVFLTDTHVNVDPTTEQLTEVTIMAAEELCRFGIKPKAALMSHSDFSSSEAPSAAKIRETLAILRERAPNLEMDGEMHGGTALDEELRVSLMPDSTLRGEADLLVMPNIDAADIAYNLLKAVAGNNITIGPILLGTKKPVHILTPSATVRRILNTATLTVVDAAT